MNRYDVIIIGGGPAGLNAAAVLGRCRRKVLLFDTGHQRNIRSHGMHNYLTRDGILPSEFLRLAKKEIKKYGVIQQPIGVNKANKTKDGSFRVHDNKGKTWEARKILIATGLSDILPETPGIRELYGSSVFHCPYCDGWEVRDKKIGVYARNKKGVELAVSLKTWSSSVTYLTDGKKDLRPAERKLLEQYKIPVITTRMQKAEGLKGKLKRILFADKKQLSLDALFFVNGYSQQCGIVEELGCRISKKNVVLTNTRQQTNVPGLYVAGDASKDMQFVVVAAAEGAKAGVMINKELQHEERILRTGR